MASKQRAVRYFDSVETSHPLSENAENEKTNIHVLKKRKHNLPQDKEKLIAIKKATAKKKQEKKRRIIIRNLSFKIDEKELEEILSKYGKVTDIKIPKKPDGKKKGFAFAQFENFKSTVQAIKQLNYQKLHGRPVAIDYAIPKDKYEEVHSSKVVNDSSSVDKSVESDSDSEAKTSDVEEDSKLQETVDKKEKCENEGDVDEQVNKFLKEFDFKDNSDEETKDDNEESGSDSSDDESDESGSEEEQNEEHSTQDSKSFPSGSKADVLKPKKVVSDDVQEGKTVFIRNISFDANQELFKEAMEEFGSVKYCLLCMDPVTELPKGTAFVKFENKEDAEKLIKKASDESGTGVFLDSRKLYCVPALSREDVKQRTAAKESKEKKDKRNLRLLREGLIMQNSEEAEGVSQTDLAKRSKLEAMKKQKLKNLNFFVSDIRLCIHNLPPNYTDQQLRKLFKEAVGGKAVITEARIMREMAKVDASGEAKSKGFGFVSFLQHEHALEALRKLNNNPSVFSAQKRPIVEFSVESHLALLKKERRREKNKLRNKRKEEQAEAEKSNDQQQIQPRNSIPNRILQKGEKRKNFERKKPSRQFLKQPSKVIDKQLKKKEKKKTSIRKKDYENLTNLVDHYKSKLLNKLK